MRYKCDFKSWVWIVFVVGLILATDLAGASKRESEKLGFSLSDVFGRDVRSEDYAGVPVFMDFGPCWCGGCQEEARYVSEVAAKYGPRGLQVIRVITGDNELSALEFQKHYRLPVVALLDTNRIVDKRYNPNGWPFFALFDRQGRLVYKSNESITEEMSQIAPILEQLLGELPGIETVTRDGVPYMPVTLERGGEVGKSRRRERFPSLACGQDGKIYIVFTTKRSGNSDVFIRVFDGESWSDEKGIAATVADECDGTVLVDKQNRVWVSWTSNAGGENYNIFVTSFTDLAERMEPMQVTDAYDDAMHARMACDDSGRVWMTYYRWHKKGGKSGRLSRDKEVYVRRWEGGKWSDEVQVSPTDVPWYEDHTDPAIVGYGDGAIVSWSWDFHQPEGYTKQSRAPTIFVQRIGRDMGLEKAVAVSSKQIDLTPAIAVDNKVGIWCAWDSMGWVKELRRYRKTVCVKKVTIGNKVGKTETEVLSKQVVNVCTPSFATSQSGQMTLLWSESQDGKRWVLKRAELGTDNNRWSRIETVESKGNPRYCSAEYDSQGRLWISYSVETDKGREIRVKRIRNKE